MERYALEAISSHCMSMADLLLGTQNMDEVLLTVIDAQKEYCDPKGVRGNEVTDRTCRKIASMVPLFRQAGLGVAWVYYDPKTENPDPKTARGGFWHVKPDYEKDALLAKNTDSAFGNKKAEDTPFSSFVKLKKTRHLLVAGFNRAACVESTVIDALRRGMNVTMLTDLCANDNWNHESLNMFKKAITHNFERAAANDEIFGECHYTSGNKALQFFERKCGLL